MIAHLDYLTRHSVKLVTHHGATNVEPASVAIAADALASAVSERIPLDGVSREQARDLYVTVAGVVDAYARTGLPRPYWMDCAQGELQRLRDYVGFLEPDMTEPEHQPDDTVMYVPDGDDDTAGADVEVGVETPISGMTPLDDTAPSPEDGEVTEFSW